jgi:hypothetical protein
MASADDTGLTIPPAPGPGYMDKIWSGELQICCIGCVQYKDTHNTLRQMGFVRAWDLDSDRFIPIADSEYEYSY